jgi:DNA helicase-2/ATP-dependent DNA helicase PcrA
MSVTRADLVFIQAFRVKRDMEKKEAKDLQEFGWLSELNPEQREAVCFGDGPLLVVAGAGSGKTRTLAYRVAYLIATGVSPDRILLLTFTRRAAEEMIRRAEAIAARGAAGVTGRVWGGTFHSVANRILRIYGNSAGLSPDFTVMDQADSEDLIDVVRHDLGLQSREKRFPRKRTCLAIYSRRVNGIESLEDVLKNHFPWCKEWEEELKQLFKGYVKRKQSRNVLDYDDLLLYLAELLEDESLARRVGDRFDHVLVDEFQDTNRVQAAILKGLRKNNKNIMVVGDDAQSIYSFRAAAVENMFDFPKDFDGARTVTLERNYRSVPPILESTNQLIAQAKQRYSKDLWSERKHGEKPKLVTCWDERQQDEYIIERVLEHYEQGVPLRRQAVLFRAAHLSNGLEVELSRRNIPFHKYGGLRFLEAAHVKDLLAFLRVSENPRDEIAWFRLLQLIDGVGPATAAKLVAHVAENHHDPTAIRDFPATAAAREGVEAFATLFTKINRLESSGPAAEVELVRQTYQTYLKKLYDNASVRLHDLENLEQIATRYRSRRSFLVDLQLDPPVSTSDLAGPPGKDEDWLVLSTIHSAKGCEWDVVYLIHASDGCLPSDMSTGSDKEIEEELRLAYVAMTRARDFLYVSWPMRYYHRWYAMTDRHSYANLSRFFSDAVRATMVQETVKSMQEEDGEADLERTADLGARIRAMWD